MHHYDMYVKVAYENYDNKQRYDDDDDDWKKAFSKYNIHRETEKSDRLYLMVIHR